MDPKAALFEAILLESPTRLSSTRPLKMSRKTKHSRTNDSQNHPALIVLGKDMHLAALRQNQGNVFDVNKSVPVRLLEKTNNSLIHSHKNFFFSMQIGLYDR